MYFEHIICVLKIMFMHFDHNVCVFCVQSSSILNMAFFCISNTACLSLFQRCNFVHFGIPYHPLMYTCSACSWDFVVTKHLCCASLEVFTQV